MSTATLGQPNTSQDVSNVNPRETNDGAYAVVDQFSPEWKDIPDHRAPIRIMKGILGSARDHLANRRTPGTEVPTDIRDGAEIEDPTILPNKGVAQGENPLMQEPHLAATPTSTEVVGDNVKPPAELPPVGQ